MKTSRRKSWHEYPIGTKAHCMYGGHWIRIKQGWKWHNSSSVFVTPGSSAISVEEPQPDETDAGENVKRGVWIEFADDGVCVVDILHEPKNEIMPDSYVWCEEVDRERRRQLCEEVVRALGVLTVDEASQRNYSAIDYYTDLIERVRRELGE